MKRTGKIIVQTSEVDKQDERDANMIIKVENYLNEIVATDMFRKFGILIRVHL